MRPNRSSNASLYAPPPQPLCHLNGLGSEVMAKDVFCWGTNNGFLHNKV
jgi:hypothetical protein